MPGAGGRGRDRRAVEGGQRDGGLLRGAFGGPFGGEVAAADRGDDLGARLPGAVGRGEARQPFGGGLVGEQVPQGAAEPAAAVPMIDPSVARTGGGAVLAGVLATVYVRRRNARPAASAV
ncbi:hypothetical protein [Kitasatospora sp. NPDC093102]|uniref:hypothetical protein n=1 Tax=Kitasatospora sp. NPDC093102 TaxID=3155069 RepID=UPI003441C115